MTKTVIDPELSRSKLVEEVIKRLTKVYPNAKTSLYFNKPHELLIATILSAQASDKLINSISPELFKKYKSIKDFADAPVEEIDSMIKKVNFHITKSKAVKACCAMMMDKFQGKVPDRMQDLILLPGVARKTANVVLGNVFHKSEGIVVDTHVFRLSKKLGLSDKSDAVKVERDLMEIVPRDKWIEFPHLLINFGREYCPARPHKCENCPLGDLCPDERV
jgi:endonuclease III